MGEQIEFPKNYERFLLKGTELMNKGNVHEALNYFEQAYERKKERISNTLYTTALYETGDFQKAVDVAEEMISHYEENEYRYIFYATLLIKAKKFLQAEAIIKKRLDSATTFYNQWLQLSQTLDAEKEKLNHEVKLYEQTLLKKMYGIGDLPLENQLQLMDEVKKLPNRMQRNGCKAVLQNPYATEIAKTAALHYLKDLEETEPVDFLWFNDMRQVRPKDLHSLEDHPILLRVRHLLQEKTEKNPSLYEIISQEAELHFMQMYPFIDEVIPSPAGWVDLYLAHYGESSTDDGSDPSVDERNMKDWFEKLSGRIH